MGGIDWRKNVPMIVDAMALLPQCQSGALNLVLAGDHPAAELSPICDLWCGHGLPDKNLITTGWISDAQLVKLYREAILTVQPSLMEGFGLSALEAMASGCAFLAARGGAVSEVVANDDLLFDGRNPADLAGKMVRILEDGDFRDQAIRYGVERSGDFQWSKSAGIALAAMRDVVRNAPSFVPLAATRIGGRPANRSRLLMDVTSTAQAPYLTGIQRVIQCLSRALLDANALDGVETVLTYADDDSGWYGLSRLDRAAIARDPRNRLPMSDEDSYLLLDSSWDFTQAQKPRLLDALVMGQEVIHGVHDIGPLRMSAMVSGGMSPHFRSWFEFVLGHSTGIICVSRAVADEVYNLIKLIEMPRPMKIGYIQLGSDLVGVEAEPDWLHFLEGRPTFIMVGTLEPRKGHPIVLRAFERLWAQGVEVNLLIIGRDGWYTRLLRESLAIHPDAERRLFIRQAVSDGELRSAYEAATALIMASYLEGFGLPVVEAGRYGCPAILPDLPVFREVSHGVPAAHFFPSGDSDALGRTVMELASVPHRAYQPVNLDWPDWGKTAAQITDAIFHNGWYKHYKPVNFVPNAETNNIGQVKMLGKLELWDRTHSLRYIEGPMISDDGHELQFIVAVQNLGSKVWSSQSGVGGGYEINLGAHIYAQDGRCLDYDHPRTPIPFVLGPGEEIYVPIRLQTNWLAREAHAVVVELVQEGVGWFGNPLTLSLVQPLHAPLITPTLGQMADITAMPIMSPYHLNSSEKIFITFMMINTSYRLVSLTEKTGEHYHELISRFRLRPSVADISLPGGRYCSILSSSDYINPAGYGLLTVCYHEHR